MAAKLYSNDVWSLIPTLVKKASKNYVAVAYLGTDASTLLPLKRNDVLIVDCSLASVKSGRTDPREVTKYLRKGVKVYSKENLHAKIYVLDNTLIIGSNNISYNSRDVLFEAAIQITEKKLVNHAIKFVKEISSEKLTPEYVKKLHKIYPTNKAWGGSKNRIKTINQTSSQKIIIERTVDTEWNEVDNEIFEKSKNVFRKKISLKRKYEIVSMKYSPNDGEPIHKFGDLFIEMNEQKNKTVVYPPCRILGTKKYKNKNKAYWQIFWETEKEPKEMSWPNFRKQLNNRGISKKRNINMLTINNNFKKDALLKIWDDK